MLNDNRKRLLLQKIERVFKENNLNNSEIASILSVKQPIMENERINTACCQLADLLISEKLSIQEGSNIFIEYYEMILNNNLSSFIF